MFSTHLDGHPSSKALVHEVKKFVVKDEINPEEATASTIVTIYYQHWWNFRRSVKFVQNDIVLNSVEDYQRPAEAQALVQELKESLLHAESLKRDYVDARRMIRA